MAEIKFTDLVGEARFTDYHHDRGVNRDNIRDKVYGNICVTLENYNAFVAKFGPGGPSYDPQLWEYHQAVMAPIAPYLDILYVAAQTIKDVLETIERAAPGTLGIIVPLEESSSP